jgi:hypothetical protein
MGGGLEGLHLQRPDCCAPYATQVEALRRLRNGGSQFVRVVHVHVNEGGGRDWESRAPDKLGRSHAPPNQTGQHRDRLLLKGHRSASVGGGDASHLGYDRTNGDVKRRADDQVLIELARPPCTASIGGLCDVAVICCEDAEPRGVVAGLSISVFRSNPLCRDPPARLT